MLELLFFWIIFFFIVELLYINNLSYLLSILFFICIVFILYLFCYDYDLFGCFVLSIYSSVFFLISLFFIYFNKYWSLNFQNFHNFYYYYFMLLLVFLFISNFFYIDGFNFFYFNFFYFNYLWFLKLCFYDFYIIAHSVFDSLLFLLHLFFYKIFVVESILINVYFFFGIVVSIAFLLIIKLWSNPNYLTKFLLIKKNFKWLFYPKHLRLLVINKFKRQTRRYNSSIVKFNNKSKFVLLWYKNYQKWLCPMVQALVDFKQFIYTGDPDEGMHTSAII